MRYIYVILTVLVLSSACKSQSSPNTPGQIPSATLPASPNTPTVQPPLPQPPPPAQAAPALPVVTEPNSLDLDKAISAERDAYKQAWQECQRSVDSFKWAVDKAMWAIGAVLALFGFIMYKNTKEHKEAIAEAKEACKEWEAEAKQILGSIKEQAKEELKTIREHGKESIENIIKQTQTQVQISQMSSDALRLQNEGKYEEAKQILGSIKEQVKEELKTIKERGKESVKNIENQTQMQMRITQLWSDALRLYNEGKYEEACDKYAEIVKLKPEDYWAYNYWGNSLFNLAKLKGDEKLFEQAFQKYEQAIMINPTNHEIYNNWGIALAELATIKNDEKLLEQACEKLEQSFKIKPDEYLLYVIWGGIFGLWAKLKNDEKLFEKACQKFEQAIRINPNRPEAYNYWASPLLYWAQVKIGTPEYEGLLKQAEEKCLKAESLKTGAGAYNLACIYALRGDKEQCKKWLLSGQEAGTLLTRNQAMKDSDLGSVRDEPWFKEIKWKGEK